MSVSRCLPCTLCLFTTHWLAACGDDASTATTVGSSSTTVGTTHGSTASTTSVDPSATSVQGSDTSVGATTLADTTVGDSSSSSGIVPPDPACGDAVVDEGEDCDDGNTEDGDGCGAACLIETGWECDGASPSACAPICGDGMTVGDEQCDDGNEIDTDECTAACLDASCGDGSVWAGNETCDDGNPDSDDGCDAACQTEVGFACDDSIPNNCFVAAFLLDGTSSSPGNLWAMSLDGSITVDLGFTGFSFTALAFHPNGTLYAATSTQFGDAARLGTIDPSTAEFTAIGDLIDTDGVTHPAMPDITFVGEQLVGWTERNDCLTLIDIATAAVTVVACPEDSFGTGMAYNSATDELVLAPNSTSGSLVLLDILGTTTVGPALGGSKGGTVKGMAYYDGALYGLDAGFNGDPVGSLVTYSPATGAMTLLGAVPTNTIDAVAVYDPANVPMP